MESTTRPTAADMSPSPSPFPLTSVCFTLLVAHHGAFAQERTAHRGTGLALGELLSLGL